jgi:hypothetical protein
VQITEAMVEAGAKAIWETSPRAFDWPGGDKAPEWAEAGNMGREPFIMLARACLSAAMAASN